MRVGFYGYLAMVGIGLIPALLAPIQVNTLPSAIAQLSFHAELL